MNYQSKKKINKYLLQKINSNVFKEPYLVMKNIDLVTNHIQKKLKENGDEIHKTLNIVKTKNNDNLLTYINSDGEKEYYRAFNYIQDCISYNNLNDSDNPLDLAYEAGKSFGLFQKLLDDFPANMLGESIKDFHNIQKRFDDLILSIENKITNRAFEFDKEIIDLISMLKECNIINESIGKNIPIRVAHNDTKLNNILINQKTKVGVVVIDLDTVMPGSSLFDLGDGIRSACSNSFETETDPEKIFLDLNLTKAYLKGYLEEMALYLTKSEIDNIALSIKALTYELAIRFLTDYINGDTYFKIEHPTQNADRFKNQYLLLKDIEKKQDEIQKYVKNIIEEIKQDQK